jgi:protein-S-isoprenylcysteine O-methyltransferase Ste14
LEPASPNATQGTIEYGWPATCFTGRIDIESLFYATEPREHWASTTGGRFNPIGSLVNAAILLLLTFSTFNAVAWALSSFTAKLSIGTLLGVLTYAAFLFTFEVADNAELFEKFPRLRELFVETLIFEYIEKFVWLSLFVTCLWLPNWLGQLRSKPADGG